MQQRNYFCGAIWLCIGDLIACRAPVRHELISLSLISVSREGPVPFGERGDAAADCKARAGLQGLAYASSQPFLTPCGAREALLVSISDIEATHQVVNFFEKIVSRCAGVSQQF